MDRKEEKVTANRIALKDRVEFVLCPLCKCLMDSPMECNSCHKAFCAGCLKKYLSEFGSCPTKCSNVFFHPAGDALVRAIQEAPIRCANFVRGCPAIADIFGLLRHLQECKFRVVECGNVGCGAAILLCDLEKHESECQYSKITCEKGCGKLISRKDYPTHDCLKDIAIDIQKARNLIDSTRNAFLKCDNCAEINFEGSSFHCETCGNFDLCNACYKIIDHPHPMVREPRLTFRTKVLEREIKEFTEEKKILEIKVEIMNFANEKQIIRPYCVDPDSLNYYDNNYFEIPASSPASRVFSLLIPIPCPYHHFSFYIQSLSYNRFYGIPFSVDLP